MSEEHSIPLALRSALSRRDFWIEKRAEAALTKNTPAVDEAQRFVDEYDELIGLITKECLE